MPRTARALQTNRREHHIPIEIYHSIPKTAAARLRISGRIGEEEERGWEKDQILSILEKAPPPVTLWMLSFVSFSTSRSGELFIIPAIMFL